LRLGAAAGVFAACPPRLALALIRAGAAHPIDCSATAQCHKMYASATSQNFSFIFNSLPCDAPISDLTPRPTIPKKFLARNHIVAHDCS
jgi:hypothetical protein